MRKEDVPYHTTWRSNYHFGFFLVFFRNFEIKYLAQLRTVWPDGYKLTQSPCLFEGQRVQSVLIEQLPPKEESTGYFVPRAERRNKAFLEHMQAYIQHFHKVHLWTRNIFWFVGI